MKAKFAPLLAILTSFACSSSASPNASLAGPTTAIPHFECFVNASARYAVELPLLLAIAEAESNFKQSAVNVRSPDDQDIGIMQINSQWLPKLAAFGITQEIIAQDPCTNINVGAWILANNFYTSGYTTVAIGAYNAGYRPSGEAAREQYLSRVMPKLYKYRSQLTSEN